MSLHALARLALCTILAAATALPQGSGPQPIGWTHPAARPLAQVAVFAVAPLDRPAIAHQDEARDLAGLLPRFAIPHAVQLTPSEVGTWDRLDSTWSLWRLRIRAPEASHVNLGFSRFFMPGDAQLMVYSVDYTHVVRPFDARDHCAARELWTPVVLDDEIVVELYVRTTDRGRVELTLGQVSSGYRFFGAGRSATAAPESGPCNIDVICPQGNNWRSEIPAIAPLSTGGSVFCSGFMTNNTAQDARDFFMTAYHCGIRSNNAPSMVVYWNYENSICGGPNNGSFSQFNTGAVLRAGWSTSDFTLVELNNPPNPAWGVTYVGWDRTGNNASSAVAIHHPTGDPKKISFEYQATETTSYLGTTQPGDGTHVRVVDWDLGTTEPGSSGSPLFDQNHRVIGQLHGGYAACGNDLSDWYGKISLSWSGGGSSSSRLSDWLDPIGTGQTTLDTLGVTGRASASPFGIGCDQAFATFYEHFGIGMFDLAGSVSTSNSILLTPTGGGYVVMQGSNAWFTPLGADLNLSDDDVSNALPLPFVFAHPGGSTSQVRMCSNGYVWLDGISTSADYTPSVGELVSEPSRLSPFWTDLNPGAGGTTHFDSTASAVYLTWVGVPEYRATGSNHVQCVLFSSGAVEFRWRAASLLSHDAIVGYSPGSNAAVPPGTDISASMPFRTMPDVMPLALSPVNRPVLGTTQTMTIDNIPAGSTLGALVFGFGQFPQGVDLTAIGMPNCRQYVTLDASGGFPVTSTSQTYQLPIPASSALAGNHLFAQALTLSPGANLLGVLASNGLDLLLDQN